MWKNLKNDVPETMLSLETIKMTTQLSNLDYKDIISKLIDYKYTKVVGDFTTATYFENGIILTYRELPIAIYLMCDGNRQSYVLDPFWDFVNTTMERITEFFNLDDVEQLRRYVRDNRIKVADAYCHLLS